MVGWLVGWLVGGLVGWWVGGWVGLRFHSDGFDVDGMCDVRSDRYVSRVANDCSKALKNLVKQASTVAGAIQAASEDVDHSDESLQEWNELAKSFGESLKALKNKIQSMRTFASKAAE